MEARCRHGANGPSPKAQAGPAISVPPGHETRRVALATEIFRGSSTHNACYEKLSGQYYLGQDNPERFAALQPGLSRVMKKILSYQWLSPVTMILDQMPIRRKVADGEAPQPIGAIKVFNALPETFASANPRLQYSVF